MPTLDANNLIVDKFVGLFDYTSFSNFFTSDNISPRISKLKDDGTAPRPQNCYIQFRYVFSEYVSKNSHRYVVEHKGKTIVLASEQPIIGKVTSILWKHHLSDSCKERFKKFAELAKELHQKAFPDYKYKPKRVKSTFNSNPTRRKSRNNVETQQQFSDIYAAQITNWSNDVNNNYYQSDVNNNYYQSDVNNNYYYQNDVNNNYYQNDVNSNYFQSSNFLDGASFLSPQPNDFSGNISFPLPSNDIMLPVSTSQLFSNDHILMQSSSLNDPENALFVSPSYDIIDFFNAGFILDEF